MFDISIWEILFLFLVILVVVGPKRLPEVARTLGRIVGWLRHTWGRAKQSMDEQMRLDELKKNQRRAAKAEQSGEPVDDR